MHKYLPQFAPFKTENGSAGFCGPVRGRRTGREYSILVKVPVQRYPETEPAVYVYPRIMSGYWQIDGVNGDPNGRLSYLRTMPWMPTRSTFASCVLYAVEFLENFDQ